MSMYGPDHHFQGNGWTLADVTSFSFILSSMSVDQSDGLRMEIGVLYLSHVMLVLAELIVCSTRGFACILAEWVWPTEISLSFTYGSDSSELSAANPLCSPYFCSVTAALDSALFLGISLYQTTDSRTQCRHQSHQRTKSFRIGPIVLLFIFSALLIVYVGYIIAQQLRNFS